MASLFFCVILAYYLCKEFRGYIGRWTTFHTWITFIPIYIAFSLVVFFEFSTNYFNYGVVGFVYSITYVISASITVFAPITWGIVYRYIQPLKNFSITSRADHWWSSVSYYSSALLKYKHCEYFLKIRGNIKTNQTWFLEQF